MSLRLARRAKSAALSPNLFLSAGSAPSLSSSSADSRVP